MKKLSQLAVALVAAAACSAASAELINFETQALVGYGHGGTFSEGAATLVVSGDDGFAGMVISGAIPGSCDTVICPIGNSSQYYVGLNDGSLSLSMGGTTFRLNSLDFGFVMPGAGLNEFTPGWLQITGTEANGRVSTISKSFSKLNGEYNFAQWNIGGGFGQTEFKQVSFNACLFDADGVCSSQAMYQSQFAIDNIAITAAVPEPTSWMLMGLGLLGFAALKRRRQAD